MISVYSREQHKSKTRRKKKRRISTNAAKCTTTPSRQHPRTQSHAHTGEKKKARTREIHFRIVKGGRGKRALADIEFSRTGPANPRAEKNGSSADCLEGLFIRCVSIIRGRPSAPAGLQRSSNRQPREPIHSPAHMHVCPSPSLSPSPRARLYTWRRADDRIREPFSCDMYPGVLGYFCFVSFLP